MKNSELEQLLSDVKQLNNLTGWAFTMEVAKACVRLELEEETLKKVREPSKKYEEIYIEGVKEIFGKFSHKDDHGKPKFLTVEIFPGAKRYRQDFDFDVAKEKDRIKEIVEFDKKQKVLVDEQEAKEKKYTLSFKSDCTFKKGEIKDDQVDQKNVNVEQARIIIRLLDVKTKK